MKNTINLNVTVDHKRFYNADSMFGVYGLIPNTNKDKIETLEADGVFVVSGSTPELQIGEDYDIVIRPSTHPKYGKGYQFVSVKPKRPKTIEEQQAYLKMMVTPRQYEAIIEKYPNDLILDLMENDEFDYSDIKGIKENTYLTIKARLIENLEIQEALVELKDLDITFDAMKKLVDYFGSASTVVQKVKNNIYELCKVKGFGFLKVDRYALNRGDDPKNKNRITAGLRYTLEKDADLGHSWMHRKNLINETTKLLNINKNYIVDTLTELEGLDESELYFDDNRVALYHNYYFEKTIKEKLLSMLEYPCATKHISVDDKIREQESTNGFSYTDEQKQAIKKAIENNVLIINGRGGTGKSTIIKGIIHALEGYSYMTCSLSGKASLVLSKQGLKSSTIHRMLGVDPQGGFKYNENQKLPYDIVVLDEASMVNNYLIYSILVALSEDAKFIMVGDSGQLPSIGTGAVFSDLLKVDVLPRQELTQVHRQAQKSGILSVANTIRDGQHINDDYDYGTKAFGELKDMTLIPVDKETNIKEMVINICKKQVDKDPYSFQVITGRVDAGDISVKNLNIELQRVFNDISKPYIKRGGYEYREGDKIIQNGNNYEAKVYNPNFHLDTLDMLDIDYDEPETTEVFNGTLGQIIKIDFDSDNTKQNHKVYIQFEGVPEIVEYSVNELQQISLAYAISTHKSQGSTIENVLFVFDYASYMLLSREFVYTGITRASKGCVMIVENQALRHAIEKTSSDNRRTFLREMLMENEVINVS